MLHGTHVPASSRLSLPVAYHLACTLMSESHLAAVLGRVPSGLFILTIQHDGHETGMLTSWVMQAGFEPPMISVALKKGRYVAGWITDGAPFVLNVVGENHKSLVSHFGRGFQRGEEAFEGLKLIRTSSDIPALGDALGYLECRVVSHIDSADHRVFLAEVTGGSTAADGEPYVHIRKNGLRY
jgi:flavin reductase (DIM6/NTAB) family NADH-FMN oxidoreductase RutF